MARDAGNKTTGQMHKNIRIHYVPSDTSFNNSRISSSSSQWLDSVVHWNLSFEGQGVTANIRPPIFRKKIEIDKNYENFKGNIAIYR